MEYGLLRNNTQTENSLLSSILNTVDDGILTFNQAGKILLFSPSAERLFGYQAEDVIGLSVHDLLPYSLGGALTHSNNTIDETVRIESQGIRQDGSAFPVEIALSLPLLPNDVYTAIIKDISEQKKLQALAMIDGLTEIPNRRCFSETLIQEISRANRANSFLSMILCDIDQFKIYNDHFGHVAGDQCLRKVAKIIENCFQRAGELTARYGGEEFAVILPNTHLGECKRLAERVRQAVAEAQMPHAPHAARNFVTMSVGFTAVQPQKFSQPEDFIQQADQALYEAKKQGRNKTMSYSALHKNDSLKAESQTA